MRNRRLLLAAAGALSIAFATPLAAADSRTTGTTAAGETAGAGGGAAGTPRQDGGNAGGADALHSGGPSNPGGAGVSTLQEALRACEGLSCALSARCQEQALADHPGEF